MSMPLGCRVAIVSSNEEGFREIEDCASLSKSGIAPRYLLVTLTPPTKMGITYINDFIYIDVDLYIALDDEAQRECAKFYDKVASRYIYYSGGTYGQIFKTNVFRIRSRDEFERLTEKIWNAFCGTS